MFIISPPQQHLSAELIVLKSILTLSLSSLNSYNRGHAESCMASQLKQKQWVKVTGPKVTDKHRTRHLNRSKHETGSTGLPSTEYI